MKVIAKFWLNSGKIIKEKVSFNKAQLDENRHWVDLVVEGFERGEYKPEATITVGHTTIRMNNVAAMKLIVR